MPKPFFRFIVGGTDITPKVSDGQVSLTITDGSGADADTAQIVIDDHNGIIVAPKEGVDIQITAGYLDDQVDFGTFTVDEVVYEGWPMQISISAQSAKAKSTLKQRRPKAYRQEKYPTYGEGLRGACRSQRAAAVDQPGDRRQGARIRGAVGGERLRVRHPDRRQARRRGDGEERQAGGREEGGRQERERLGHADADRQAGPQRALLST